MFYFVIFDLNKVFLSKQKFEADPTRHVDRIYFSITNEEYESDDYYYLINEGGELVKDDSKKVDNLKNAKLAEIEKYWNGPARIMLIKNGHSQPIIADQSFINNLESAKSQAEYAGFYTHQIRDENDLPILENGQFITVKMTKNLLEKIGGIVQVRRGLCNRSEAAHRLRLSMLQTESAVAEYSFSKDENGEDLPSNIIQIVASEGSDIYG